MKFKLLLGRRHPFEDDLEIVDLGNADVEVMCETIANTGFPDPDAPPMSSTRQGRVTLVVRTFPIGGVEAFGESVVDVGEHRASLVATTLFREQPREP